MRMGLCQLDIAWEDKEANHRRVTELLAESSLDPGSLLLLPEMYSTGFSMNVDVISESESGPSTNFLRGLAVECGLTVVGGVVTKGGDGLGRNQAVAFTPNGEEAARYSKIHPFQGAEARKYAAGDAVSTFDCGRFTAAPFVCYDLRFPEVFRMAMCRGADLMLVIANWPDKRIHHWVSLLQARAIENQAYVAGVNRCGSDPYLSYPGRSLVVDPHGRIIAEADDSEQCLTVDLDPEAIEAWRRAFPVLEDRRCDIRLGSG